LPLYYLKAIAQWEGYDLSGCVTRFEIVDRILAKGVVSNEADEPEVVV
jgi:hypothetical protein